MLGINFRIARLDPTRGLERYLARRPRARSLAAIASALTLVAAAFLFVLRPMLHPDLAQVAPAASAVLGFGAIVVFSVALKSYQVADWLELSSVRRKSEKLQNMMGEHPDVFDIVQLSLTQLTEYYTINKSQARKSFNFSVGAVAVGLATVIAGVWLVYSRALGTGVGTVSAVSGVLLQFFGGANFYIYNRSLIQMNYFYDRLMQMQDAMLSIKVGDQISNTDLKDKVKEHIASQLLAKAQSKADPFQWPKATPRKSTRADKTTGAAAGKAS